MCTRKRLLTLALLPTILLTLGACAPAVSPTPATGQSQPATSSGGNAAKSQDPYLVGFVNSFTGYMAPMGLPEQETVLMLEEIVNKNGGINGRPLKLISYDDESDETKGVLAIKKAINEDKVIALIGTAASGVAMAEAPVVEEAQVPWVTMQSSTTTIVGKKWIFKLPVGEGMLLQGIEKWIKDEGYTKVAWINQGAAFGRDGRKYLDSTAPGLGINVVIEEEYGPNDTDMKPQLTKVKASDAQALVVYGAEAAAAIVVRQAKEMGITIPIIGPESLTMPAIMGNKQLRDGLEGAYLLIHKPDVWEQLPDNDIQKPALKTLADQLKAKYGPNRVLSNWEAQGNDSFLILVDAIKRANPDTSKLAEARSKIRDAIEQTKGFVGAVSPMNFSPTDHDGTIDLKAGTISQIKDGKFKLIKVLQ